MWKWVSKNCSTNEYMNEFVVILKLINFKNGKLKNWNFEIFFKFNDFFFFFDDKQIEINYKIFETRRFNLLWPKISIPSGRNNFDLSRITIECVGLWLWAVCAIRHGLSWPSVTRAQRPWWRDLHFDFRHWLIQLL